VDPIPVTLHSTHGHPAHGADLPVEWYRTWRPAHTVAVAILEGHPVLLRDVPAEDAAKLEWALYARQERGDGWVMADTGHRLRLSTETTPILDA
jgi:hypothetical protein